MNPQNPIVGIDLGTTHSLVAYVDQSRQPQILPTREGGRLLPSVISFPEPKSSATPTVGVQAKKDRASSKAQADQTVFSVKRLLGKDFKDIQTELSTFPYPLLEDPENGAILIPQGGRTYSPIEISALILRELKLSAEAALHCPVKQAVITVPAYFNDSQRAATRAAGRLAGWEVLRILNEPTAASLAFGLAQKKNGLIAVYDLGGGTFDISILKLQDGIFEVLSTNGNSNLGGDDMDRILANKMKSELIAAETSTAASADESNDNHLWAHLLDAAEKIKIAFGQPHTPPQQLTHEISLPNGGIYTRTWTLAEFEGLMAPVLEQTVEPCIQALKDAGLKPAELSEVVLVGGPTRLACIQKKVTDIFGRTPNTSVHPDEVVALGAAIQADILAGNNRDLLLLDVVPLSLGIETYGGLTAPLIPRNSRIPTVAKEIFTTFADNQSGVDIHVVQGERERVMDNRSLARFKLTGIPREPAGMPRIEVTFLVDADGILQVSATDFKTGKEQTLEVKPSYGLTDEQIHAMLLSSLNNAETDLALRSLLEVRTDAEAVLNAVEARLPDAKRFEIEGTLPHADLQQIEQGLAALKGVLHQNQIAPILAAKKALNASTLRLAELVMKNALVHAVDSQTQPRVTFMPSGQTVDAFPGETLLGIALRNAIPLKHSCGGHCACTSCHVFIRTGQDQLSPIEDKEEDRLDRAKNVNLRSRLACQTRILGNVEEVIVEIPN